VLFIGTKYTMQDVFITKRISSYGIEVLRPTKQDTIDELHRIIHEELTYGNIIPDSKNYVIQLIHSYAKEGIEAVILGCTEFPLLVDETDVQIPIFNTAEIHAKAGVQFILNDE